MPPQDGHKYIDGVDGDIARIDGAVTTLTAEVATLNTRLTPVEADVAALKAAPAPGGVTTAEMQAYIDMRLADLDFVTTDAMVDYVNQRLASLPSTPGSGVTTIPDTYVDFDTTPLFGAPLASYATSEVDRRITAMNDWWYQRSGPTPGVVWRQVPYNHAVPIHLVSGSTHIGLGSGAAREYSRSTVLNYQGAAGSSQFVFPYDVGRTQPPQSYPNATAPRDMYFDGIMFKAGASVHCFPVKGVYNSGRVMWMTTLHNVGWNGFLSLLTCATDGVTIAGDCYAQAFSDTGFIGGGSESAWFVGGQTFIATSAAAMLTSGKPLVKLEDFSKGTIGNAMITARKGQLAFEIAGGHGSKIEGLAIDSQTSDPIYGAGMRVTGGRGHVIKGCSIKGVMSDPAQGAGGVSRNRGFIQQEAGRQILYADNTFSRYNNVPGVSVPVLFAAATVGRGEAKFGWNTYSYWDAEIERVVVQQASADRIALLPGDPKVQLLTAA